MESDEGDLRTTIDVTALEAIIARWPGQMQTPYAKEMFLARDRVRDVVLRYIAEDALPALDDAGLREVVRTLWASGTWQNKDYLADLVLKANPLNELRPKLQELLYGKATLGVRIVAFLESTKHIGLSTTAELLFWVHPDTCWLANRALLELEESVGFDLNARLPHGQKRDPGARYLAHEPFVMLVRERLLAAGVQIRDYRDVDAFVCFALLKPREGTFDCILEQDANLETDFLRLVSEHCPEARIAHRREAEARARAFLEKHLGTMTPDEFREFLQIVNADLWAGKARTDRYSPAFSAVWVNDLLQSLDAINDWSRRLWQAPDSELPDVLSQFWAEKPIHGAGYSLPTLVLYLRSPESFAIRMGVLDRGIRFLFPKAVLPRDPARSYDLFNRLVQRMRELYNLAPEAMDIVLTQASKQVLHAAAQPGFTNDSFQFLKELGQNNNTKWMQQNLDRYRRVRDALEALTAQLADTLVKPDFAPIFKDDPLETSASAGRCMSRIERNAFGRGNPYYAHMWSAFFRKSQGKKADAQIFVILRPEYLRFGFGFGKLSKGTRAEFRDRVKGAADRIWRWIAASQDVQACSFEDDGETEMKPFDVKSAADLVRWAETEWPSVSVCLLPGDPKLSGERLLGEVTQVFRAVFPLFVVATRSDWESVWNEVLHVPGADPMGEGGEEEEVETDEQEPARFDLDWLQRETHMNRDVLEEWAELLKDHKQVILYGPPGTGKTFVAKALARHLAGTDDPDRVQTVQFHPAYSYEDFVEGLRPDSKGQGFALKVVPGAFREFCAKVKGTKPYVLIIDELNRGNLAKVFGELMYLLEYRDDVLRLPRSGESFGIPPNLFIIGTMNTADRSIALVDYALRRRFRFLEVTPSAEVLQDWLDSNKVEDAPFLVGMFSELNKRLELRFDRHLKVGHSYFMDKKLTEKTLPRVWNYAVLPLIEEYFCGEPKLAKEFAYEAIKRAVDEQLACETGAGKPPEA